MKVSPEIWLEKMANLKERRSSGKIKNEKKEVDDYMLHIHSCKIGKSVLDVGCGSCEIKKYIPGDTTYIGIDPFPYNETIIKSTIEDCTFEDLKFDTVCAFAMLDNVIDLEKAIQQIKRVCSQNVIFLTGIDIEPDGCHTVKIVKSELIKLMEPFKVTFEKQLQPKIILIEFTR